MGGRGRARAIAAELAELPHAAIASAAEANPVALKILRIAVSPHKRKIFPLSGITERRDLSVTSAELFVHVAGKSR